MPIFEIDLTCLYFSSRQEQGMRFLRKLTSVCSLQLTQREDEDEAHFCEYLSVAIYNESNILILSDLL